MGAIGRPCAARVPTLSIETLLVSGSGESETPVAVWLANDDLVLHGYRAGDFGWITIPGLASFRFAAKGAVKAGPDGGDDASIRDAWLRSVMPLVIQARGTQVLHASAVASDGRVMALCGTSTAGKSTLAAGLMQRGYELVADDALPFDVSNGAALAFPVPFRLRLRPGALDSISAEVATPSAGNSFALGVLMILRPDGETNPPRLLKPAAAVGALMPHAYCFSLDEGKEELVRAYGDLASAVPVYELRYEQQPGALDSILDTLEELLIG